MFKLIVAAIAAFFVSGAAHALTFTASKDRTVYIRGQVADNALDAATRIMSLASVSKQPIDIVINSPGGSIYAGLQTMSAIGIAQTRGIKVRCLVPVLAASMAFQILAMCDERYTLQYSLLLFHPARSLMRGAYTAEELEYQGTQLRTLENRLKDWLAAKLGMDRREFDYHYKFETMWIAPDLNARAPGFIKIVDDIRNVDKPFDLE